MPSPIIPAHARHHASLEGETPAIDPRLERIKHMNIPRVALRYRVIDSNLEREQRIVLFALVSAFPADASHLTIDIEEFSVGVGWPPLNVSIALRRLEVRGLIRDELSSGLISRWCLNEAKIGELPLKGNG